MANSMASASLDIIINKKNIADQVLEGFDAARKEIDGRTITYQIAADEKQLQALKARIEQLSPEIRAGVNIVFSEEQFKKQIEGLDKYVGKSAEQIGKDFAKNLNKAIPDNISEKKLAESFFGKGSRKEFAGIIKELSKDFDKNFSISNISSLTEVEDYAKVLKALQISLNSIGDKSVTGFSKKALDDLRLGVNSQLDAITKNVGGVLKQNVPTWIEELKDLASKDWSNVKTLLDSLKQGLNISTGSGTGKVVDDLDEITKELEKQQEELKRAQEEANKYNEMLSSGLDLSKLRENLKKASKEYEKNFDVKSAIKLQEEFQKYVSFGGTFNRNNSDDSDILNNYDATYDDNEKGFIEIEDIKVIGNLSDIAKSANARVNELTSSVANLQSQLSSGGTNVEGDLVPGLGEGTGIKDQSQEVARLESLLEESKQRLIEMNNKYDEQLTIINELTNAQKKLEGFNNPKVLESEEYKRITSELNEAKANAEGLQISLTGAIHAVETLSSDLSSYKNSDVVPTSYYDELRKSVEKLHSDIEKLNLVIETQKKNIENLKSEKDAFASQSSSLLEQLENQKKVNEEHEEEISLLQSKKQELEKNKNELDELLATISELDKKQGLFMGIENNQGQIDAFNKAVQNSKYNNGENTPEGFVKFDYFDQVINKMEKAKTDYKELIKAAVYYHEYLEKGGTEKVVIDGKDQTDTLINTYKELSQIASENGTISSENANKFVRQMAQELGSLRKKEEELKKVNKQLQAQVKLEEDAAKAEAAMGKKKISVKSTESKPKTNTSKNISDEELEKSLREILIEKPLVTKSSTPTTEEILAEKQALEKLKEEIKNVTSALNLKTKAIKDEETQMNLSVKSEIDKLQELIAKINEVKDSLNSGTSDGLFNKDLTENQNKPQQEQRDLQTELDTTKEKLRGLISSWVELNEQRESLQFTDNMSFAREIDKISLETDDLVGGLKEAVDFYKQLNKSYKIGEAMQYQGALGSMWGVADIEDIKHQRKVIAAYMQRMNDEDISYDGILGKTVEKEVTGTFNKYVKGLQEWEQESQRVDAANAEIEASLSKVKDTVFELLSAFGQVDVLGLSKFGGLTDKLSMQLNGDDIDSLVEKLLKYSGILKQIPEFNNAPLSSPIPFDDSETIKNNLSTIVNEIIEEINKIANNIKLNPEIVDQEWIDRVNEVIGKISPQEIKLDVDLKKADIASGATHEQDPKEAIIKKGRNVTLKDSDLTEEQLKKRTEAIKKEVEILHDNIALEEGVIKSVTNFYDSAENLVKTQTKVEQLVDGAIRNITWTTNYSKDGEYAYSSHIDSDDYEKYRKQEQKLTQEQIKAQEALYKKAKSESDKRKKESENQRSTELNNLLSKQKSEYEEIYKINLAISKLDVNKDATLIAELREQKKTHQENYVSLGKQINSYDDILDRQKRSNALLEIKNKYQSEINKTIASNVDKEQQKRNKEELEVQQRLAKEAEEQKKANQKKWNTFQKEQQDYITGQYESDAIERNKKANQELIDTIQQYGEVKKRIANEKAFDGDVELAEKLETKISELQKQPILSSAQIEDSERKLVKLYNELDVIEKTVKQKNDSKQKSDEEVLLDLYKEQINAQKHLNSLREDEENTGLTEHQKEYMLSLQGTMEQRKAQISDLEETVQLTEELKQKRADLSKLELGKQDKTSVTTTADTKNEIAHIIRLENLNDKYLNTLKERKILEDKKASSGLEVAQQDRLNELVKLQVVYEEEIDEELDSQYKKTGKIKTLLNGLEKHRQKGWEDVDLRESTIKGNRLEDPTVSQSVKDRINSALSSTSALMSSISAEKSGISGFDNIFKNTSDKVEVLNNKLIKGTIEFANYEKQIEGLASDLKQIVVVLNDTSNTEDGKNAIKEYIQNMFSMDAKITDLGTNAKGVSKITGEWLDKETGMVKEVTFSYNNLNKQIRYLGVTNKEYMSNFSKWLSGLKERFGNLGQYLLSFVSFYEVWGWIKQGVGYIRELDTALTEMKKVSDETTESLKNFQKESFKFADNIGATAAQIENSAADFMRLGYSLEEASRLAQDANIYANVGDMEIDEATEHMISSIKAWGSEFNSEVEASSAIIDRYNEIGNNFAISSADIGSAMERSAAALKAGGNTLNEALGLITAGELDCLKNIEIYFYSTHLTARTA